jgi:hypothetical protein
MGVRKREASDWASWATYRCLVGPAAGPQAPPHPHLGEPLAGPAPHPLRPDETRSRGARSRPTVELCEAGLLGSVKCIGKGYCRLNSVVADLAGVAVATPVVAVHPEVSVVRVAVLGGREQGRVQHRRRVRQRGRVPELDATLARGAGGHVAGARAGRHLAGVARVRVEEGRVGREDLALVEARIRDRDARRQGDRQHRRRVVRPWRGRRRGWRALHAALGAAAVLGEDPGHRPRGDPRVRHLRE